MDIASTISATRWVIAGTVVVLAVAFIAVYRRLSRRRLERQMAKAELIAMIDEALGEEGKHGPTDGTKVWGQRPSWLPTALAVVVVLAVVVWAGMPVLQRLWQVEPSVSMPTTNSEVESAQDMQPAPEAAPLPSKPTYKLAESVSPPGSGEVSPDSASYSSGESVTLTAKPSVGYEFAKWAGDASGTSPTITMTMDSDRNIIANFERIRYNLSTSISPTGSGSISPNSGIYDVGTQLTLTATPASGYRFTLTATPASGYRFTSWWGDASGTSPTVAITMDSNRNIIANFERIRYTLSTSISPTGSGSISPSSGIYDVGTQLTLTATPASNYQFDSWAGDAFGTDPTRNLTVDRDIIVTANFIKLVTKEAKEITLTLADVQTKIPSTSSSLSQSGWKEKGESPDIAMPHNGAISTYRVEFWRKIWLLAWHEQEMINEVAVFPSIEQARKAFEETQANINNYVYDHHLGDESWSYKGPLKDGIWRYAGGERSVIFRKDNVLVYIWLSYPHDLEFYATPVLENF